MSNRALAVFTHHGAGHWADRWLAPGYRHVFVCLAVGDYWLRVDAKDGRAIVEVVCGSTFDLATFYRDELGFHVVETETAGEAPRTPFVTANCVGLAKVMLQIRAPFVWTPRQLYARMTRSRERSMAMWGDLLRLPGKSVFDPPKPPEEPPPPPKVTDPAVEAAAKRQRQAELMRQGRRASQLTGPGGVEGGLGAISRPEARGATLMGQVGNG